MISFEIAHFCEKIKLTFHTKIENSTSKVMLLLFYNCNVSTLLLIFSLLYIVPLFAKALVQNNFQVKIAI